MSAVAPRVTAPLRYSPFAAIAAILLFAFTVEYAGTDVTDADSDGDDVRDGADDQDHDDLHNLAELSRNAASGRAIESSVEPPDPPNPFPARGHVNPYNPCLPFTDSRTCNDHPPLDGAWSPFGEQEKIYYVFN